MKIRLKMNVGTFHSIDNVRAGDVVDVDDENGARYCALGYAEPVTKTAEKVVAREERKIEKATHDAGLETATMGAEVDSPPHQVSKAAAEPDSIVHDEIPKPKPRAPRTSK